MLQPNDSGSSEQPGVSSEAVHSVGSGSSNQGSSEGDGQTHTGCAEGDRGECGDDEHDQLSGESGDSEIPDSTVESLRDPAVYGGTFCHEPEENFIYSQKQLEFIRACGVFNEQGKLDLDDYPKNIALAAVNEFGKTLLIADLIRYFLDWIPGCNVGFTSHVGRQCEALENYLAKHQALNRFKDWTLVRGKLTAPNGNWARWFTAKDVGAVESLHAPKFMVRIVDEIKSMDDDIVDATARWKPKLSIFVSSKGLMSGRFYEAFTLQRHLFRLIEASAFDCPWMTQKSIEHDIEMNGGRNSALVRSMIYNEWSDVSIKNLISLELIEKAIKFPPYHRHNGEVVAGLDVSAAKKGGDECVLAWRRGNIVEGIWVVPYSENEMEVIGRVLHKLREIKAKHVFVDAGGAGGFAAARLEEVLRDDKSLILYRENFGGSVMGHNTPAWRRGTELWCVALDKLEKREIGLPDDPKMVSQFTSREYVPRSDGKITLVDKQTMRRKGLKSPDRADAVVLCLCETNSLNPINRFDVYQESDLDNDAGKWESYKGGHDLGVM